MGFAALQWGENIIYIKLDSVTVIAVPFNSFIQLQRCSCIIKCNIHCLHGWLLWAMKKSDWVWPDSACVHYLLALSFVNCRIWTFSQFLQLFIGICLSKLGACRLRKKEEIWKGDIKGRIQQPRKENSRRIQRKHYKSMRDIKIWRLPSASSGRCNVSEEEERGFHKLWRLLSFNRQLTTSRRLTVNSSQRKRQQLQLGGSEAHNWTGSYPDGMKRRN